MIRAVLFAFLFGCAPLAAQAESNFGRVVLGKCDVIAQGVASAQRTKIQDLWRVEFTIEQVLHGKNPGREVQLYFGDIETLKKDEAVRGLFALKALSSGGFQLVGKPVPTPTGDVEEKDKVGLARAYIELEAQKPGEERTRAFWELLHNQVRAGGYWAQNAAIELMFIAKDRNGIITEELFATIRAARDNSLRVLTRQCRADLDLALQGMVEARVKSLKFKKVRRAEKAAERARAVDKIKELHTAWPRAFTEADAKLCDALFDAEKDASVRDKLSDLTRDIRFAERQRKAEEERKSGRPAAVPAGE